MGKLFKPTHGVCSTSMGLGAAQCDSAHMEPRTGSGEDSHLSWPK